MSVAAISLNKLLIGQSSIVLHNGYTPHYATIM